MGSSSRPINSGLSEALAIQTRLKTTISWKPGLNHGVQRCGRTPTRQDAPPHAPIPLADLVAGGADPDDFFIQLVGAEPIERGQDKHEP
jgi:hypothetical protein